MMFLLGALAFLLPPIHVVPPVRVPKPMVHRLVLVHPLRVRPVRAARPMAPVDDGVYQRRLIVELCAARPVFCDWVVR